MENSNVRKRGRPMRLSESQRKQAEVLHSKEGASVRRIADFLRVSHMAVWRALSCDKHNGGGENG